MAKDRFSQSIDPEEVMRDSLEESEEVSAPETGPEKKRTLVFISDGRYEYVETNEAV